MLIKNTLTKIFLIAEILKLDACSAYNYRSNYIENDNWISLFGCWERPYIKFVICKENIIGETGGPSQAIIKEYKFLWNKKELLRATKADLLELKKNTIETYNLHINLFEKYGKMSLMEILKGKEDAE